MQTIQQQKALKAGQQYNHDPRHFAFARTVEGFYPEPDAIPMDIIIFGLALLGFAIVGALIAVGII